MSFRENNTNYFPRKPSARNYSGWCKNCRIWLKHRYLLQLEGFLISIMFLNLPFSGFSLESFIDVWLESAAKLDFLEHHFMVFLCVHHIRLESTPVMWWVAFSLNIFIIIPRFATLPQDVPKCNITSYFVKLVSKTFYELALLILSYSVITYCMLYVVLLT